MTKPGKRGSKVAGRGGGRGRPKVRRVADPVRMREREFGRLSRLYTVLSEINKSLVQVKSREELFQQVCEITARSGRFKVVWIGRPDARTKQVLPVARAGARQAILDQIAIFADDRPEGRGPVGVCVRTGRPVVINAYQRDARAEPWRAALVAHELRAAVALPIRLRGEVWGALAVYDSDEAAFQAREVALLEQAAANLSFALDHLENEARRSRAEAALRESHEQLKRVLEVETVGMMFWDLDSGRLIDANDTFLKLMGYSRHDVETRSLTWQKLTPPEYQEMSLAEVEKFKATGHVGPYEKEYLHKDGTRQWFVFAGSSLGDNRCVEFCVDISDRKKAEAELRLAHARLRRLVDANIAGVVIADAAGQIIEANDYYLQLIGFSRAELEAGKIDWRAITPPEWLPADERGIRELHERGTCAPYEKEYLRRDGTRVPVLLADALLPGPGGQIVAFVLDLSERKQVEDRLRLFRAQIERSSDAIEVVDAETARFVDVNETACRMVGYTREELLALKVFDIDREVGRPFFEAVKQRLESEPNFTIEAPRWRKDGTRLLVEISLSAVDLDRKYLVAIVRDITARKRVEDELRVQGAALNAAANAIVITNPEGNIQWANAAFAAISGYSLEESAGRNLRELVRSGRQDQLFYRRMWDTILTGQVWHGEIVNRRKDRSLYTEEMTITPVRGMDGVITHFIAIKQNITERKRAEAELHLHKKILEETGAIAKVGGWSFDVANGQAFWTDEVARIHDLDPGEPAPGLKGLNYYTAASRPTIEAALNAAIERGVPYDLELEIETAKGVRKWVRTIAHPVIEDDRVVRVHGSFQDITERRRAEERIREQAALLDRASDAIYVTALDCTVLYWNAGAEHIYGWSAAEAVGRKTSDLNSVDEHLVGDAVAQTLEKGEWTGERRQSTKDGRAVEVLSRLTLLRDDPGQPQSILVINTDITERKQLEARFLRAQRLESLGALASGIAHDLNNVLAPIMMSMPLLRDSVRDDTARRLLGMVETSAQRGADIVRQVLTFARGSVGERIVLQPKHLVRDMLKLAAETFPKNLQVMDLSGADVWTVEGDATQLHQALMNLCVNARDAMPEGGRLGLGVENVTVDEATAAQAPGAAAGRYVRFRVADTGHGIPPEMQERIFEPFFTTKGVGKGTGLGLSTVLGIVKGHGGFVRVESQVDRGTAFELYFPAAAAPLGRPAPTPGTVPPWPRADGELVLLVDDEAAIRAVARQALEEFGYRVLLCEAGAEAIRVFKASRAEIRLVVTDMMMPEMDGPTLVHALRAVDPAVKIVGITGVADDATMQQMQALRLAASLAKPFTIGQLLTTVREALVPAGQP